MKAGLLVIAGALAYFLIGTFLMVGVVYLFNLHYMIAAVLGALIGMSTIPLGMWAWDRFTD